MALGKKSDQEILGQFGIYEQQDLAAYISRIGRKVAAQTGNEGPWTFRVLDSPVVNAFALPGGYVYVTRGMLAHMQDEAQLATVLGHEIGHVTARHTAQKITREQLTNLGLGVTALLFKEVRPYLGLLQAGAQVLFLRYSRDDEREADQLGVQYAMAAGYAANEAAEVFHTLDELQRDQGVLLPTWAATHPPPAERETTIRKLALAYRQSHPGGHYGGAESAPFLARLNQLVYGENPRHGFVRNGTFYHPDLRFQFPVPAGWRVENLASRVLLLPPEASPQAAIVMVAGNGMNLDQAIQSFREQNRGQIVAIERTTVNGLPAYTVLSRVPVTDARGQRLNLAVRSTFIGMGERVFALHGQTAASDLGAYDQAFKEVMGNFQRMTDPTLLATEPVRIRTFKAPRTDAFADLVRPMPRTGVSERELAIINQREPSERVLAGTVLKSLQ